MPVDAPALFRRYQRLLADRSAFDDLWQEIVDYVLPFRAHVTSRNVVPGEKKTTLIFDSTGTRALTTAASAVHGTLTPSTMKWFSFSSRDRSLDDEPEVRVWLDTARDIILAALNSSNFDSEIQEAYIDLLGFGTACIEVQESDRGTGIVFRTHQPGRFVIAEDEFGFVDTVFIELELSIAAAAKRWGLENLSERSQRLFQSNPDERITVIHAIFPRDDVAVPGEAPTRRPVASVVIEAGTGSSSAHVIREGGFHEMPVMVARWRKLSGEVYGRGPGIDVLPDIRSLNKAVKLRFEAWVLALAPPIMTLDRAVIGEVRLKAFGRTHVRDINAIKPLEVGSRFDVSNFEEEKIRAAIRNGFFIDLFAMAEKPGTPVSATEIAARLQQMQRVMGPVVSRLQAELISPLINRVFRILFRRREIPPAPAPLMETGIDIVLEGPLARIMRLTDVESTNQFLLLVVPLAQVNPAVLSKIDFFEVVDVLARATGVPARVVRPTEEAVQLSTQQVLGQALQQVAVNGQ